ncbi:zinc finger and SCAN domain-containing protein 12-like isoform X6 [Cydia strobilella]|uniref:zinc finger and SCAN domain-containing protein 12-like isoform X6 n=1 Tax=Cydia strobilella TaxID=1100964 RepID=UPI003007C46F
MMETPNTLNSGMCRCCSSEGTFKDIKTQYHWMGEEEVYAEMLTDCFDIKIQTPEDMDNGICEVCITQLRNAVNFKKQVLHTEEQFKRRLQGRDVKNPIKIESAEDPIDSDHLSDPDFTEEYEVPIKQELEEKPKAKKRQAKSATPRAKKAKTDAESSQHVPHPTSILEVELLAPSSDEKPFDISTSLLNQPMLPVTAEPQITKRSLKVDSKLTRSILGAEMAKHEHNLEIVLRHSNATPIRGHSDVGYMCFFCRMEFPNPDDLKAHTLDSHRDLMYDDQRPPKYDHYSVKLDVTNLACQCFTRFDQLTDLIHHLQVDHDQPIHAEVKNYFLPFRFDSGKLKCASCETEFEAFRNAVEHMNIHYRNHICDVCDAGFVTRASLQAHKRIHVNGEYQCTTCHQVYNTKVKLHNHVRYTHQGQDKRNKCSYCGEKFSCITAKNSHLVKEHGVAPKVAKCSECDKTFGNDKILRMHYKSYHLKIKNFKCSDCTMEFSNSGGLKRHMVKHTGARDYKCEVCQKAFGRESTMRQHMRIHINDRRHKCEHCAMAFIQKCSLKSHLYSKHGIEMEKVTEAVNSTS